MQVRSGNLTPLGARGIALLCATVLVTCASSTALAAGVVGTGTAASCTDAALDAALAGGGMVTFDCGGPATIDISTGTGTKMITADTTIDGGGLVKISGGNRAGVFSFDSGVKFTVENLTIANGYAVGSEGSGNGGAIFSVGTLTVTNSTFTGNSVGTGYGGAIFSFGTLTTVTNSTFTGNSGCAIFNDRGTLTVTNSTFAENSGGICNRIFFDSGGTATVVNSTFTGNSFGTGGAIFNGGPLTVANGTFVGNSAKTGGAISSFGTLTVTNSTFTGNSATEGGFGGICGHGGGIFNDGTLTVTNSTFTGNSAIEGGGIDNFSGFSGSAATVTNTIVANNLSADSCSGRAITDGGHNLDDGTSCGFSTANGSLSNTDPQLDPAGLQDNGGPTQTVALCTRVDEPTGCTAASPAIDAGDESVCAAAPVNNLDQRGFVRPGVGHTDCSIGAYEADATPAETCVGDCDGDGMVAINELILGVNIDLAIHPESACPAFANSEGTVDIAQLIKGVNHALNGCGIG